MMKPFLVELTYNAVVMAKNETDAFYVAGDFARKICNEDEPAIGSIVEVKSIEQLKKRNSDWDGDCIPWNTDGDETLTEILDDMAKLPVRDTKTKDMFNDDGCY